MAFDGTAAMVLVLAGWLVVLGGCADLRDRDVRAQVPAPAARLSASVATVVGWWATGPLQLSAAELAGVQTQILDTQRPSGGDHLRRTRHRGDARRVTEVLLVLFVLIFLVNGGAGIWQFLLGVVQATATSGARA